MPPAVYTQSIIALIWDFDKTLTHGYMQDPLFDRFGVSAKTFWDEVNGLKEHYGQRGYMIASDTIYLNHILTYIREGVFKDLTAATLKTLGGEIKLAPGLPDFFQRVRESVVDEKYDKHDVKVEHYIVSTGLRAMIEGCSLRDHVDGIWACDLLPEAAKPGYLEKLVEGTSEVLTQVGYTVDNTSKTRAIFEINKGVNRSAGSGLDVNSKIPHDQRRVPFKNMIYIADGPSDIPSFSVVNNEGGKTFAVHAPGQRNYENAYVLQEQGRVNSIALADYSVGSAADMWLTRAVRGIADEIVVQRERALGSYGSAPGHVT